MDCLHIFFFVPPPCVEWAKRHTGSTACTKRNERSLDAVNLSLTPISPPINLPGVPHPSFISHPSSPLPPLAQYPVFYFQSMLAPAQGPVDPSSNTDPLILYSQSLRDYTLRLWMESRKQAEERVRARAHKKHQGASAKASMPPTSRKESSDGESASDLSNDGSTMLSSHGLPA